eukprot:comp23713_c0_seq1/m.40796 comp23713_c0_seq1/g.40796  ORF comp23713_c0_seq1/g.40796 comp23713_c0_seq1/m.40796 type:complete len:523 (-) comp23713_c0_seq1:381-1949(-)
MGKKQHQKDKLYITHTEWSSVYGGRNAGKTGPTFKRLPYNCCCLSFQPFQNPVCDKDGNVFDLLSIVPYIKKYGTNPVTGEPLKAKDLIKLSFHKNAAGEYHDPVTFKQFTDNAHIVANKLSGNVFLMDTIDRLNVKPKFWKDLISDEPFKRTDLITIQDPQNPEKQNFAEYHHVKNQLKVVSAEDQKMMNDPAYNIRSRTAEAKDAMKTFYKEQEQAAKTKKAEGGGETPDEERISKSISDNRQAMSFTSTATAPVTRNEGALLAKDYVRYGKIKKKGYARIQTNMGDINIELHCNVVPKTCENFILLAERGYYNNTKFHRLIRNFMIQGGDPTGTGTGGESAWGGAFEDEWKLELSHDKRGTLSMANSGPDTNKSQFFITFRPCTHLDKKHTIFARIVGGMDTLVKMERVDCDDKDKPKQDIVIEKVVVFVNPFADIEREKEEELEKKAEEKKKVAEAAKLAAAAAPKKAVREGPGKYIAAVQFSGLDSAKRPAADDEDLPAPKPKKVITASKFGNFDNW